MCDSSPWWLFIDCCKVHSLFSRLPLRKSEIFCLSILTSRVSLPLIPPDRILSLLRVRFLVQVLIFTKYIGRGKNRFGRQLECANVLEWGAYRSLLNFVPRKIQRGYSACVVEGSMRFPQQCCWGLVASNGMTGVCTSSRNERGGVEASCD